MERRDGDFNLGYFDQYPAPVYEALCRLNPAESINSTTPFYGPLLYTIARAIGAHRVLEIGVAQGWTSGFLAWAVQENNVRYGAGGQFWAIDIDDKAYIQKNHDALKLPSSFIHHPEGSVHFLEHPELWPAEWGPEAFDLIFIDGLHETNYVRRETELVYPLLKGNGNGYLVHHDVYAFMEKLWPEIVAQTAPDKEGVLRPRWEHMRFLNNYGLGLLRKMEGYDHKKQFWPDGDQKDLAISQGYLNPDGTVKRG